MIFVIHSSCIIFECLLNTNVQSSTLINFGIEMLQLILNIFFFCLFFENEILGSGRDQSESAHLESFSFIYNSFVLFVSQLIQPFHLFRLLLKFHSNRNFRRVKSAQSEDWKLMVSEKDEQSNGFGWLSTFNLITTKAFFKGRKLNWCFK